MDYLDLKKQARHRIILLVGYVLVAFAVAIAALVLLYQAYGFGIGKNGNVIQNGLSFFSSHPSPASIYVNNVKRPESTNTRLVLPEGIYQIKLSRSGYRDWQRTIEVDGGQVHHFDYPFLIPKDLAPKKLQSYSSTPGLFTQSPDRRWLVVQPNSAAASFEVYDLKNPAKPALPLPLPANVASPAAAAESFSLSEWADDNKHVLLEHNFDGKLEYILLDRTAPEQAVNLNTTLSINPTKLYLRDKKFDQYYLYDASAATLRQTALKATTITPVLQRVLAFKPYGSDTLLYITDSGASSGKVLAKLKVGSRTANIRSLPPATAYLVDLAKYSGDMYVAFGATTADKVYVYKDPLGQVLQQPNQAPSPAQVLHVPQPNYLSFSNSAQFIVAENGAHFGIYDFENEIGFNYVATAPLDPPQSHASWMDGNRLTLVGGGQQLIFDYDSANRQNLVTADSHYLPAFAPDYKFIYNLVAKGSGQFELTSTSLLTPADR